MPPGAARRYAALAEKFEAARKIAMTAPSLRRLWTIYKKLLVEDGMSRRDQVLAQGAFYASARSTFKVLDYLLEPGDEEEVLKTIQRQARLIKALQGLRPRRGGN